MPKRAKRPVRRGRRSAIDRMHYPLYFNAIAGEERDTTCQSLYTVFDRKRPFRIAELRGEMSGSKYPVPVQFQLYSPVSTADNVWTSPVVIVPTGTLRRFRWRIPASATQWYPSDTAASTILMKFFATCLNKDYKGLVTGTVTATIELRPIEVNASCPSIMHPPASTSQAPDSSVAELGFVTDDEYFST